MVTIASPKAEQTEINIRAHAIQSAIESVRAKREHREHVVPVAIVYSFPRSISPETMLDPVQLFEQQADEQSILRAPQIISGSGFIAVDGVSDEDDASIHHFLQAFCQK